MTKQQKTWYVMDQEVYDFITDLLGSMSRIYAASLADPIKQHLDTIRPIAGELFWTQADVEHEIQDWVEGLESPRLSVEAQQELVKKILPRVLAAIEKTFIPQMRVNDYLVRVINIKGNTILNGDA